jgi:hypothetical protein
VAPPPTQDPQDPKLLESTGKMSSSPNQDTELQDNTELRLPSPPAQDPEFQGNMELRLPSTPTQDLEL